MAVQIQIRNGTAAQWTSANPTLAVGEMGAETDTGKFKIGTGSTAWNSLAYAAVGTVTSVAQSFTGGIVSVGGSPISTSGTLALTVAGTSGGVPYFSSGTTWASSAALASNALVVGGGAGAAPSTVTTGTGVVTALGVNTGSAGAFVVNGGDLGTPSAGVVTNLTGTASININGTVGATTPTTGAFTTATARAAATQDAVTLQGRAGGTSSYAITITPTTLTANRTLTLPDETGTLLISGGALGTPSSGTVTNLTGTASININGTVGATTPTTGVFTTATARAAATQDSVILQGRAGGTSSYGVTLTPTTLSASRTITLPNADINFTTGLGPAQGGTGVANNAASTLTISGAFGTTLTVSGTTALTLPTTGTLSTLAGTETLTNKTLTNPTITNYTESVVPIGTVTTTNTIALTSGTVQTATLTASTACTFTMPTATAGKSFTLLLKQAAATGNGTATFTGVKWGTAGAPTITATAGKMDILSFIADGTNWYGSIAQGYTP